ncbi:MAG TPA: histidine kinase [Gaiellaceae bacterium]|nr:histidine kinase [Gaiellaceae bacterium]
MTTQTVASLEQTRARQQRMLRAMRPLGFVAVALVATTASQAHPRPGLSGERLGILAALVGFAVGVVGVMQTRRRNNLAQAPFFAALVLSSATLVALQPKGPAILGAFIAVAAAAMRVPGRAGVAIVVLALVTLPVAEIVGKDKSGYGAALQELGVVAFYVVARLAARLAEGQEQAERLLRELEETRDAEARAAVLAERQRLAREMHDVLAHSLSGLALQLEGARLRAAGAHDQALVDSLERAHHLARNGIEEARRAIGMLRGDELPGPERLPGLVADFERDTGIPASITIAGESRSLGSDARLTLFRTAQEALTNIRKHARPDRVELWLAYEQRGVRLRVEDFGAPAAADGDGGGYGLTGMRERAELLGGTLAAGPAAEGFRVELWVPA